MKDSPAKFDDVIFGGLVTVIDELNVHKKNCNSLDVPSIF